jgi:hypothetical protein
MAIIKRDPKYKSDDLVRDLQSDYCRLHQNVHGDTMSIWLEVNFALWVMIGCATEKAIQFIQYLN